MSFSHPLARRAKVWPMISRDGTRSSVLVIVTTLELDSQSNNFKKRLVERLSAEAADDVAEQSEVSEYILIDRLKDWE
jgi:hypothetical protein